MNNLYILSPSTALWIKWTELTYVSSRGRGDRQSNQGDVMYPIGYSDKPVPDTSIQESDKNLVEKVGSVEEEFKWSVCAFAKSVAVIVN